MMREIHRAFSSTPGQISGVIILSDIIVVFIISTVHKSTYFHIEKTQETKETKETKQ